MILYLVTMRVRLLTDLATFLARQGRFGPAERVFAWAEGLWPDQTGSLVVQVNRGVMHIQQGKLDEALATFKTVLAKAGQGYLGVKYEAAAHYNLGVAYQRQKMKPQSIAEFEAVLETWPVSEYARRAREALARKG